MRTGTIRFTVSLAVLLLLSGAATAGEKKLMHCFVFTPIEAATASDWEAFYKATDELPGKPAFPFLSTYS